MKSTWLISLGVVLFGCCPEGNAGARMILDVDSKEQLVLPTTERGKPAAGKKVFVTAPEYAGTTVYHTLYLPKDWDPNWRKTGKRLPIIFEYTGNYFPQCGSTGEVKDAGLGFGLSGGKYIWVSLPYVQKGKKENAITWWGDIDATVTYAKTNVPRIITEYGGDPQSVFLCGFSRGSIAVNFIGLHDDEIANLWTGFITHDHFDGERAWGKNGWGSPLTKYRKEAAVRLARVKGRPYLVGGSIRGIEKWIRSAVDKVDNFTFHSVDTAKAIGPFPNKIAKAAHNDRWLIKPSGYRTTAWAWMNKVATHR